MKRRHERVVGIGAEHGARAAVLGLAERGLDRAQHIVRIGAGGKAAPVAEEHAGAVDVVRELLIESVDGSGQVVGVLRGDGPPGEHEGLAVADVLVDKRLGVKALFGLARRGPVDEHGRVAGVPAGNLEEVAPAVGLLVGRIDVRHVLAIEVGLYRREAVGAFLRQVAGDFEDIAIGEPVSARQLLGIIREVEKALLRIGTDVDALHYLAGRAEPKVFEEIEVAAGGSLHGGEGLARFETAAHAGLALERPAAEIIHKIDGEVETQGIGSGHIERPGLETFGILPGGIVDVAAQEGDLGIVLPVVGHRTEQRAAVEQIAAPDDLAGVGILRVEPSYSPPGETESMVSMAL